MSKQYNFSTEILDEWKEKLEAKNITNSIKHLKYAQEKIILATLDLNAYYYILKDSKNTNTEWQQELSGEGKGYDHPDNDIVYFDTKVPIDIILNKLCINYFNSLHGFFDSYAYFLHRWYYSSEELPKRLSFYCIKNKLESSTSFEEIKNAIERYTSGDLGDIFNYIKDLDNLNKHLGIISPNINIMINDGSIDMKMPTFTKDTREHDSKNLGNIMEDAYELVVGFYNETTQIIFN